MCSSDLFAVGLSRQLYGLSMHSERPFHRMYEQWHPLGTIGVITAFNFPNAVWAWNAMIAAVAGDAVVWKPSRGNTAAMLSESTRFFGHPRVTMPTRGAAGTGVSGDGGTAGRESVARKPPRRDGDAAQPVSQVGSSARSALRRRRKLYAEPPGHASAAGLLTLYWTPRGTVPG